MSQASSEKWVTYIETEYFGGEGNQSAIVFENGKVIFGPKQADIGPINEALKKMGAIKSAKHKRLMRIIKAALIIFVLIFISCRGPDTSNTTQGPEINFIDKDKFQITADSLRKEGQQVIFHGGVELKFGQMLDVFSRKTIFHYSKSNSVKLMEFIGNVQMLTDNAKITSEKAFTNNIREYIEFEGNVNIRTKSGNYQYDHYKYYFNGQYRFIVPDIQAFSRGHPSLSAPPTPPGIRIAYQGGSADQEG